MEWMLMPYKKLYAAIAGRSSRQEFWMFTLLNVVVVSIFILLFVVLVDARALNLQNIATELTAVGIMTIIALAIPFYIWAVVTIPASIAVTIRRLHDLNLSGWLYVIFAVAGFIPFVNLISWIILLVMMCIKGTEGSNKYGADPTKPETSADVFS